MDALTITVEATDVNDLLDTYSHVRLYRGDTSTGPWELISADEAVPAIMVGTVDGPSYNVAGLRLLIQVDRDTPLLVDFPTSYYANPVSLKQVVDRINFLFNLEWEYEIASPVQDDLRIELRSPITGRESRLEILATSNSAASALGFLHGALVYGAPLHAPLRLNVFEYTFRDQSGDVSFWYCADYYNITTLAVSEKSDSMQGIPSRIVDSTILSLCKVSMIDLEGRPVPDLEFRFHPLPPATIITDAPTSVYDYDYGYSYGAEDQAGDKHVVVEDKYVQMTTNGLGYAELNLLKGANVRVLVGGTSFVRDFVVPEDDEFFLFDIVGLAPDGFDVAIPVMTWAQIRSS